MRSPLDIVGGEVTGAILTTFTLELPFIDHWLHPLLSQAGVRNVVILADESIVAEQAALGESARAGQTYHVGAIKGRGIFHPKVIYLAGPDHQRACISSANLTSAGQLRNLETAAAIASDELDHLAALQQVRGFLRRLVDDQPAHIHEAVLQILEHGTEPPNGSAGSLRFVHNLDQPIVDQLPVDVTDATAPFVSTALLERLHSANDPVVSVDVRRVEAFSQDDGLDHPLRPIEIRPPDGRSHAPVVHGKALWHRRGWCLVGSPNLTGAALLRTASSGNVEAGLFIEEAPDFHLPDHDEADRPDPKIDRDIGTEDGPVKSTTAKAFSAVLEGELRVDGLEEGTVVLYATETGWERLGVVVDGRVNDDERLNPRRLRADLSDGTEAFAIVHRLLNLRARRQAPKGPGAAVVDKLPLDLQGIQQLEEVLNALYQLDDLAAEERAKIGTSSRPGEPEQDKATSIDEWRPARPGDDPRVPDLYRRVFPGEPDALLALIRRALRIEPEDSSTVALEDDEQRDDDAIDEEVVEEEQRVPRSSATVVRRYRTALLQTLDRGAERIRLATDPGLRDLTFQNVLRYHEVLPTVTVRVDPADAAKLGASQDPGEDEFVEVELLEPAALVDGRLRILDAYINGNPTVDGVCGATLLAHLSAAVDGRGELDELQTRRLDDLCYQVAPDLLAKADPTVAEIAWLPPQARIERLEPYATRVDWFAIVDHAEYEGWLERGDLDLEPHPTIQGSGAIRSLFDSPAWTVLGYALHRRLRRRRSLRRHRSQHRRRRTVPAPRTPDRTDRTTSSRRPDPRGDPAGQRQQVADPDLHRLQPQQRR